MLLTGNAKDDVEVGPANDAALPCFNIFHVVVEPNGRRIGIDIEAVIVVMGSGMSIDLFIHVLMAEHREEIHLVKQVNTHA